MWTIAKCCGQKANLGRGAGFALLTAVLLGGVIACSAQDDGSVEEAIGETSNALTISDVWRMESATTWTVVTGSATKQVSTTRNEGNFSLELTAPAFVAVRGEGVDKPAAISPQLAVDVMIPTQAGPFYHGAVQLSLSAPSLGIFNAWVGQRDLAPPKGVWQTLQFQIPSETYAQLLASPFNDLAVTIGVNPPSGLNQPYRLDNLRFVPSPGCVGVPDGTACDDLSPCTTGSSCTAGVCGSVTTSPPGSACDPGGDVLGFENFPAWQVTENTAALAPSTTRVQGERSLSVTAPNFVTVGTIPLATLHKVSQTLSLRVLKPTHQPNQFWHGDVTLKMAVPSLGIQFTATRPLLGNPSGAFFELLFQLPAATYQQLATSSYSDLRFSISVNPPSGQSGFYLLDDLHFVPVTTCSGVLDNTACEDGSFCTTGDACRSGVCGVPVVCDDGNVCTSDSCNPASGCVFTNNAASCSDGNACTGGDVCQHGTCVSGPQISCNDGSGCTNDSCAPATGCVFQFACGSGTCVNNACCQPKTCADLNVECGIHPDGCGSTVDCNSICPAGGTCNPVNRCLPPNIFQEETGINVCEILLEELIIPAVTHLEFICGDFDFWECAAFAAAGHPNCCVPLLCDLDPVCLVSRVIIDHPEIILSPGELYCKFRSPEEYLTMVLNGVISNVVEWQAFLATGGLSELIKFHVDIMKAAGKDVPGSARQLVRDLTAPIYNGGASGFSYDDLDDVKIISSDFPTAGLYLPGDRVAITMGPVVILRAKYFDALFNSQNSAVDYTDFLTDPNVCDRYVAAIDVLIHELVHVHQYAELGQFNFWAQYLGSALVNGYGDIGFEEEAFDYHIRLAGLQGGQYCDVMKTQHDSFISGFTLPTPANACTASGTAMDNFPACP